MSIPRVIQYGYDSKILIESTHGSVDFSWVARQVDGSGIGYGDTHREAVWSLVLNMRREADKIETLVLDDLMKNE